MMKTSKIKICFVAIWLAVIFGAIVHLFWQNELVYSLPTPVPVTHRDVKPGEYIDLKGLSTQGKPLFLHFFNPACPCSRFNIPHVRSLVRQYENKVAFAIVVMSREKYTSEEIKDKFGADVPVFFDKSIADACGVYSTPQGVIIDTNHKLYFRGNYNKSRYCTDKQSNYAQMAIDSLLNHTSDPHFNQFALKAYGCQLPNCTK